jgi:hypothetical protein
MPETWQQLLAQRSFVYDYAFCQALMNEEHEEFAPLIAQVALLEFDRRTLQ